MKYQTICLEGIDKCGKDLIAQYIIKLCEGKYIVNCRGIISQIAYNNLYNRCYKYDISQERNVLYIRLDVDKKDWELRCKLDNEPKIDYYENVRVFENAYNECSELTMLRFNTSFNTPYSIALNILDAIEKLNKGDE